MRISTPIQALSAAMALALLAGCSGGSSTAPKPSAPQGHAFSPMTRIPAAVSPLGLLKVHVNNVRNFVSFNFCPAIGRLVYISDFNNSLINIYAGNNLVNQAPCGQLGPDVGVTNPQGMFVRSGNHRLFVANTGAGNVIVFVRGGTAVVKTFTDPTVQYPVDVTIANDGTVIASNVFSQNGGEPGSLSTWHTNAVFVGNFPMPGSLEGLFVTVLLNGRVYFNDIDSGSGAGRLWRANCPFGACGGFVPAPPTTNTIFPGGLRARAADTQLIQFDQTGGVGGARIRYILPGLPPGISCNINGSDPVGFDMNPPANLVWYADAGSNTGQEMNFNCVPVGSVAGNTSGLPIGAAVDVPEPI